MDRRGELRERFVAGTACVDLAGVCRRDNGTRGTAICILARFDQPDALGRLGQDHRAERGVWNQQMAEYPDAFHFDTERVNPSTTSAVCNALKGGRTRFSSWS